MLAYRHAFHAGNHADVLKHMVLVQVLDYMGLKDKPYRLIDTHAGAGGYSLKSPESQKRGEYAQGIGRLWDRKDLPGAVADYVKIVRSFNVGSELQHYPGSPEFERSLLRAQDELRLFELHPTDFRLLSSHFGQDKRTQVTQADGFASLKGQVPPVSRRAVVLMDPSYELASDYDKTVKAVRDALTRFAEGVYVVWYPQVTRRESQQLPKQLKASAPKSWLHVWMTVQQPDAQGFGLMGSGMFVFNPPYTLAKTLREVMPWLTQELAQFDGASFAVEERAL
jgi:23S rRNA (adenine2030-N6)-methyltransferase